MKKLITTFMIVAILFNFIFSNICFADENSNEIKSEAEQTNSELSNTTNLNNLMNNGNAGGLQLDVISYSDLFGTIAGILAAIVNGIPAMIHIGMWGVAGGDVTIKSLVFNQVPLFNVNYFNFSDTYI